MLKRRIIPCLDVKDGRVVKGVQFQDIKDVNDPVQLASFYANEGADELVFYDITASFEKRKLMQDLIQAIARSIHIPFTVGGGIASIEDISLVLLNGADKVSLNSSVLDNPSLITEGAKRFGSQCIVVSMDVKRVQGVYKVFQQGGRIETRYDAVSWAKQVEALGAGELVINSMDQDGRQTGFDLPLLQAIEKVVNIPIIASGGAGSIDDFIHLAKQTNVDGYLAASVFHYQTIRIATLKLALAKERISVRL
jgi:imidazole glycerol-phosphate synthase subunit HisF